MLSAPPVQPITWLPANRSRQITRRRRNRPIFFIDIAVPRNIDPEINRLTNSYVYDIDDLKGVIDESIENRNKEAIKGERIVDEAVIGFRQWYDNLDVVPTIVALREQNGRHRPGGNKKNIARFKTSVR